MKKRIGFVARGLTLGGVTRFIENILGELAEIEGVEVLLFTDDKSVGKKFQEIETIYIPSRNKLYWDLFLLTKELRKARTDAIIYPKNVIPLTHVIVPGKKINIIHDIAHFQKDLKAYKFFDSLYMKMFIKLSCMLAYKTVAVSNHTKDDLVAILGIAPSNIEVVYEGVESKFTRIESEAKLKNFEKRLGIERPFIFYHGSISPRKNIYRLVKAFEGIEGQIPHNLYLFSGKNWGSDRTMAYLKSNPSSKVKLMPRVTDEELIALYSMTDLYLYLSLYEGFGLPILEAQSCGSPVLTSRGTSCGEIASDSALLVDPYSVDSISEAIITGLTDTKLRENLIERGYKNAARFSWRKAAKELMNVLEQ